MDAALREVRLALLEADVNFKVVKDFIARVRERAVGEEVTRSLTPAQQVVKIVHEELVVTLGERNVPLQWSPRPPTVLLMAGLQGSGKTTTAAKLGRWLAGKGRKPPAGRLRPPAPGGRQAAPGARGAGQGPGVRAPAGRPDADPVPVARGARDEAERTGRDVVIVDTAGRLAIDAEMMAQAAAIREAVQPTEVLLVVDAMTGQDAVATAQAFQEGVDVTGFVLTKLDGDAQGGAALSIRSVTDRPIKFAATGEKLADFDAFHPDRLAGRILGMGDVLTLIERAEEQIDREQAEQMERKLREATFTLEDFLDQLQQVKKMGPLSQVLGMLPGMSQQLKGVEVDDRDVAQVEAIIRSMTPVSAQPQDPQRLPPGPHRPRLGHHHPAGQRPPQAVRGGPPDDEAAVGHDPEEAAPDGPALDCLPEPDKAHDGNGRPPGTGGPPRDRSNSTPWP